MYKNTVHRIKKQNVFQMNLLLPVCYPYKTFFLFIYMYDQCLTHDFALPVTSRFLAINLRTFSGDRQANSERISVNTVANPCLAPFLVDAKPFTRRFTLYFNSSQQEMSSSFSSSSLLSPVF